MKYSTAKAHLQRSVSLTFSKNDLKKSEKFPEKFQEKRFNQFSFIEIMKPERRFVIIDTRIVTLLIDIGHLRSLLKSSRCLYFSLLNVPAALLREKRILNLQMLPNLL